MRRFREFFFRLQLPFRRRKIEADLHEEIENHLALATEAHLAAGLSPAEARAAALREFGHVDGIKETYRDVRGFPWFEQSLQDFRLAARSLRKNPAFAVVAILTLALGIGVNTTMFSFLTALLYRPVPFPAPERIVELHRTSPQTPFGPHAPADLLDAQAQNEVFSHFAIVDAPSYSLATPGQPPERVSAAAVSGDFFALLGMPPLHGRVFGPAEDKPGHNGVVVLSYAFWQRRFGGDPRAIGRHLRLDGESVEIIGVMPEDFRLPLAWGNRELWRPLALTAPLAQGRNGYWLLAIARLKPEATLAAAEANLNTIAARLATEYPATNAQSGYFLTVLGRDAARQGANFFWMLMGLAAAVLLIACANLANLQLARNSRRAHEYAVRIALGAGRSRLVRMLLAESLLVALLGGIAGVFAAWGTNQFVSREFARMMEDPAFRLELDYRVLAFALGAALVTGVVFGLSPAWLATRVDASAGLKRGTGATSDRSRGRLREGLVMAELSLTLVLMSAAGYFLHGIYELTHRDLGWREDHLLTARFALPAARYGDVDKCAQFYSRLNTELAAVPGVRASVTCDIIPLWGFFNQRAVVPEGAANDAKGKESMSYVNTTTPGYFDALGMKLLQGRDFTAADRSGSPAVVIVNQTLAQQLWPNENPIGKRLGSSDPAKRDWMEIVGVVNDVGFLMNPNPPTKFQIYRPMAQTGGNYFAVVAHTSVPAHTLADELRRAVERVDPDLAAYQVASIEQLVETSGSGTALIVNGIIFMAVASLLLSAIGIYGLVSNLVVERTREIGIRIALGARLRTVVWMVLRHGLRLAAIGIVGGSLGAVALAAILGTIMPGIRQDPPIVGGGAVMLFGIMLVACWLPARRAARVDPMVALRAE